jgi:acetolactate synthase small subunit
MANVNDFEFLSDVGINVVDVHGNMKTVGKVLDELSEVWNKLNTDQQDYITKELMNVEVKQTAESVKTIGEAFQSVGNKIK